MFRSAGNIFLPLLKTPGRSYHSQLSTTVTLAGTYIDPFVALISHSCDPNVWVVFESNRLRVRALREIPVGTEIVLSILGLGGCDYEIRKSTLLSVCNINCTCTLCRQGHMGPSGELLGRLRKYEDNMVNMLDPQIDHLPDVQRAISDMQAAGFGFDARLMPALYKHAIAGQIRNLKTAAALKLCLALYYHIEPVQTPRTPLWARIDTLFVLYFVSGLSNHCQPVSALSESMYSFTSNQRLFRIPPSVLERTQLLPNSRKRVLMTLGRSCRRCILWLSLRFSDLFR
jgi:hypothetical protein